MSESIKDVRRVEEEGSVLPEAQGLVYGARHHDYGHPLEDFERTAAMVTAILGSKLRPGQRVTPKDWALMMCACKVSREIHRPKRDNLVDLAGYAECARRVDFERGRGEPLR